MEQGDDVGLQRINALHGVVHIVSEALKDLEVELHSDRCGRRRGARGNRRALVTAKDQRDEAGNTRKPSLVTSTPLGTSPACSFVVSLGDRRQAVVDDDSALSPAGEVAAITSKRSLSLPGHDTA